VAVVLVAEAALAASVAVDLEAVVPVEVGS
jgi:hypothetical protein